MYLVILVSHLGKHSSKKQEVELWEVDPVCEGFLVN